MLLTADLHLDDNPDNEYRWQVFNVIADKQERNEPLYILGDLCDRKDRHSAALVNRLFDVLQTVRPVTILMGNHDMPLRGRPYWDILSFVPGIRFVSTPTRSGNLLLLPNTLDPETWDKDLFDDGLDCILMHQTMPGATLESGFELDGQAMAKVRLPRGPRIYSGDVHVPQRIGRVVYVGSPHPVKFGDYYKCRMLRINDADYSVMEEIILHPIRKRSLTISSLHDLKGCMPGDQLRISYQLGLNEIDSWAGMQRRVAQWAAICGVTIVSLDAVVPLSGATEGLDPSLDPQMTLTEFCAAERLSQALIDAGRRLLANETN